MDLAALLTALAGAVFGGGTTAALVNAYMRRRVTRAEAADALADSAIELLNAVKSDARADVTAMRQDLSDARREAAEARREAAEARLAIRDARREAEQLASYLDRVVSAIHDQTMTLERLRLLVGNVPGNGGTHRRVSPSP
jgi:chromosome segregation ATPase